MIKILIRFFDRLEDSVRAKLSHRSIMYAFIGGATHVIFWRGIWITSDIIRDQGGFIGWLFYEPVALVWSTGILLLTGLFVASFIGERIIISGLKNEKRTDEKTADEIVKEEKEIKNLEKKIISISKDIEEIKNLLKK
jgi:hypothetical protein